jgi:hypothetical protein
MFDKNKLLDKCEAMTLLCTKASSHCAVSVLIMSLNNSIKAGEKFETFKNCPNSSWYYPKKLKELKKR